MPGGNSPARTAVLRAALLFTPFLAIAVLAFVLLVQDAADQGWSGGRIIGIVLVSSVALLLGYQVVQSTRDLFGRTIETTGRVERRWSRNEFFLFRNGYIFVGRNVFRLEPERFVEIDLGDTVRIVHYPHTNTVESIEVLGREKRADEPREVRRRLGDV
jgi:hypothetical protein